MNVCGILVLGALGLLLMARPVQSEIQNGNFQAAPNVSWMTRADTAAIGDAPTIARGLRQNRFGHAGDRDGRGKHGQAMSRIFQSFSCGPRVQTDRPCEVSFRFKTGSTGQIAFVGLSGPAGKRGWRLPSTGGLWSGQARVVYPSSAGESLTIEFGIAGSSGELIGGYVSIDDVRDTVRATPAATLAPLSEEQVDSFVSGGAGVSIHVPIDLQSEDRERPASAEISFLLATGLLILVWRMTRSWKKED